MIVQFSKNHFQNIAAITKNILQTIPNKAYFNWSYQSLADEVQLSKGFVSVDQNQVVGFILYRESLDVLEIMVLAVNPTHQRTGIMSCLIKELQKCAAQQNKALILEVHAENQPAIDLYSKLGFQKLNMRKNYYQDGQSCYVFKWADSEFLI